MINENQLNKILYTNKSTNRIKSPKMFFGSPLKNFISNIYNQFEIPKESFYISMFYIKNYYDNNKEDQKLLTVFFNNINYFVFASIILSLKIIFDESLNVKGMCEILFLNFNKYKTYELDLLKGLNWDLSYNNSNYNDFKIYLCQNFIN